MQLVEDHNDASYQIQHYVPGQITISGKIYQQALLVMPEQIITNWLVTTAITSTAIDDLAALITNLPIAQRPEVILLGTGAKFTFVNAELLQPISKLLIGIEVMDTAAACRTYTVLISEARRVLAALII